MSLRQLLEREKETFQPKPPSLVAKVTRSLNQSATQEYYQNIPLTPPNRTEPIIDQFNRYLVAPSQLLPLGQEPTFGPYGSLGFSPQSQVVGIKNKLAQLPVTVSLEARGVFLTTLLDRFHPQSLGRSHQLPPTYDYARDRYLAQSVYGGNGLYKATEEWVALSEGKYPRISAKIDLPWLAMYIRHTLLKNPQLLPSYADVQTAIDILMFSARHFRKPHEDVSEYIERMSEKYWRAHHILQKFNLLPGFDAPRRM